MNDRRYRMGAARSLMNAYHVDCVYACAAIKKLRDFSSGAARAVSAYQLKSRFIGLKSDDTSSMIKSHQCIWLRHYRVGIFWAAVYSPTKNAIRGATIVGAPLGHPTEAAFISSRPGASRRPAAAGGRHAPAKAISHSPQYPELTWSLSGAILLHISMVGHGTYSCRAA